MITSQLVPRRKQISNLEENLLIRSFSPKPSPRTFKIAASAVSQGEKATGGAFKHSSIVVKETCSYKNVLHLFFSFESTSALESAVGHLNEMCRAQKRKNWEK